MTIEQIEGKTVKLSARSITVIGDNGKTCGIVRNVSRFEDMPARERYDFWRTALEVPQKYFGGLYGVINDSGKYDLLLVSLRPEAYGRPGYADRERAEEDYKRIESSGIKVILVAHINGLFN